MSERWFVTVTETHIRDVTYEVDVEYYEEAQILALGAAEAKREGIMDPRVEEIEAETTDYEPGSQHVMTYDAHWNEIHPD